MRSVPRLCEFYPGICLTSGEKTRKNLGHGKKNLSQSTVYTLRKHPHIKKNRTNTHAHTHTRPHITKPTHTHIHTLQNNIKPPQYKLKQTQYKICPSEISARTS